MHTNLDLEDSGTCALHKTLYRLFNCRIGQFEVTETVIKLSTVLVPVSLVTLVYRPRLLTFEIKNKNVKALTQRYKHSKSKSN